jgi:hypothetical protein
MTGVSGHVCPKDLGWKGQTVCSPSRTLLRLTRSDVVTERSST